MNNKEKDELRMVLLRLQGYIGDVRFGEFGKYQFSSWLGEYKVWFPMKNGKMTQRSFINWDEFVSFVTYKIERDGKINE